MASDEGFDRHVTSEDTDDAYITASQNPENDIFIVYSSNDKNLVQHTIYPQLKDHQFKVFYDEDFTPGGAVISNITDAIRKSKKTLMVLTQEALDSAWCKFELLLALEKTQQTNVHSVVLLLKDLTPEQVSIIDVLRIAPKVEMRARSDWIQELVTKLRADVTVGDILPAGNVAHGQVWSHFFGFLKYILPVLEEKIQKSEWYQQNPGRMPFKMYEMIPESCMCPSKIADIDNRVQYVGNLEKIEYERAGNKRNVIVSVYSVTDDDGSVYYCVCEYPSVIGAIYQMEHNNLAQLTKEDRRLQLSRFYYTLNAVLTHSHFQDCYGKARVLLFNDTISKPSTVLLRAIKEDLQLINQTLDTRPLARLSSKEDEVEKHYEYDVYVAYCDFDKELANEIIEYFQQKGMVCFDNVRAGRNLFDSLKEALCSSQYFIFILSKESLHEDWFSFSCLEALHTSITNEKICVIPVLKNITSKQIPEALGWVTYVEVSEDDSYLKRLHKTCKDVPMQIETLLPAGNVADGLAWAYVVNYLRFILLDPEDPCKPGEQRELGFTEKIDAQFQGKGVTSYICPKKLYVLIPQSCDCPPSLDKADKRISKFVNFSAKYRNQSGVINRTYHCDIYKIQVSDKKEYYFVGQFAAPVQCLREMNEIRIAGLNNKEMYKEAKRFCEITKIILHGQAAREYANRCELIYYNDNRCKLGDVMVEQIQKDTQLK